MQIVRSSFMATRLSRSITRVCSSWVPWEKFNRATSMPARIRSRSTASELLAGPMVQTILALRPLEVTFGRSCLASLIGRLGCLFFPVRFDNLGIDLRVELGAQQHDY